MLEIGSRCGAAGSTPPILGAVPSTAEATDESYSEKMGAGCACLEGCSSLGYCWNTAEKLVVMGVKCSYIYFYIFINVNVKANPNIT